MRRSNSRGLGLLFVAALAASSWISPVFAAIGEVIFVSGDVKITDAQGRTRQAVRSTQINEGDSVLTGPGASTQVRMIDKGFIAVRPDTQMKFDKYQYQGREDGSENALMSLLKGGFRSITGIIGHANKNNFKINTPSATIGIRGSDIEQVVVLPVFGQGGPVGQGPAGGPPAGGPPAGRGRRAR